MLARTDMLSTMNKCMQLNTMRSAHADFKGCYTRLLICFGFTFYCILAAIDFELKVKLMKKKYISGYIFTCIKYTNPSDQLINTIL